MRQTIGSPLVVQIGHERGTAFLLKHPGELEQRTRIDRNIIAGRISLWRRVGVLSGGGESSRFFVLEPGDADEKIEFGSFFVRGQFSMAWKCNNAQEAKLAYARFQPRDPTVDDLITYLARSKGKPSLDWMIAYELLLESDTTSKALDRLKGNLVHIAGASGGGGFAWALAGTEADARGRARELDVHDLPLVALAREAA